MIGRLNHVAIAVPDVREAAKIYRDVLGATVTEPPLPLPGVGWPLPTPAAFFRK